MKKTIATLAANDINNTFTQNYVKSNNTLKAIKEKQKAGEDATDLINEFFLTDLYCIEFEGREYNGQFSNINWSHPFAAAAYKLCSRTSKSHGRNDIDVATIRELALALIQRAYIDVCEGALLSCGTNNYIIHLLNRSINYRYTNPKRRSVDAEFGYNRVSHNFSVPSISLTQPSEDEGDKEYSLGDKPENNYIVQYDTSKQEEDMTGIYSSSNQSMALDKFSVAVYDAVSKIAEKYDYDVLDICDCARDTAGEYMPCISEYGDASKIMARIRRPEGKMVFRQLVTERLEALGVAANKAEFFLSGLDEWTDTNKKGFRNVIMACLYRYVTCYDAFGASFIG